MGNLLSDRDSFMWEDVTIDRGNAILELNEALVEARRFGDNIFISPDFYSIQLSWGDLIQTVFARQYEEIRNLFPWLTQLQHTTLIGLFGFLRVTTPNGAQTIEELDEEFKASNNGRAGIQTDVVPQRYVSSRTSWLEWHMIYVTNTPTIRFNQYSYFKLFYKPHLSVPPNQINQSIAADQTHPIFRRLDTPTFVDGVPQHNEQIHMTFEDDTALNIDGTWKHPNCRIPVEARRQLLTWGFLLPEDQELD